MQFNWSTFIIEIVNFVVLIWILKRLLYLPVKNTIECRRKSIQASLDEASKIKEEATILENKYENRLNEWEKEKSQDKKSLYEELDVIKEKELDKLKLSLAKEQEKHEAIQKHQFKKQLETAIHESMQLATDFLSKLLVDFADQALEKKIVSNFAKKLPGIDQVQLQGLESEIEQDNIVSIQSAYELDEKDKKVIEKGVQKLFSKQVNFSYSQQPDLLAGLNIQIGSVSLQANLRDELKFFSEVAYGSCLR